MEENRDKFTEELYKHMEHAVRRRDFEDAKKMLQELERFKKAHPRLRNGSKPTQKDKKSKP